MKFSEYVTAQVGTTKWVVAARLTERLRARGYTVAITSKRFRKMLETFEGRS